MAIRGVLLVGLVVTLVGCADQPTSSLLDATSEPVPTAVPLATSNDAPAVEDASPATRAPSAGSPDVSTEPTSTPVPSPESEEPSTPAPDTPTPAIPPAPEFSLPDLDGTTWSLSQFRGRSVLLFFWATW